jgi:hypothetical protein
MDAQEKHAISRAQHYYLTVSSGMTIIEKNSNYRIEQAK